MDADQIYLRRLMVNETAAFDGGLKLAGLPLSENWFTQHVIAAALGVHGGHGTGTDGVQAESMVGIDSITWNNSALEVYFAFSPSYFNNSSRNQYAGAVVALCHGGVGAHTKYHPFVGAIDGGSGWITYATLGLWRETAFNTYDGTYWNWGSDGASGLKFNVFFVAFGPVSV
jgi:hypothetical protein